MLKNSIILRKSIRVYNVYECLIYICYYLLLCCLLHFGALHGHHVDTKRWNCEIVEL